MHASDVQDNRSEQFAMIQHVKVCFQTGNMNNVGCNVVITFLFAERNQFFSSNAFHSLAGLFIIAIVNDHFRGIFCKLVERTNDVFDCSKVVQMVSIDVQQDGNIWIQLQEGVHKFTGFTGHDVTVSTATAAMNAGKLSANDSGRVCSGIEENLCCHGSGGCFAMCAGDADGVVIPAGYESEQFAPFHQVNTMFCSFFCSNQFRIICHNGSGVNNQVTSVFMASSSRPPQEMLDELEALCRKEFTYKPWRKFILSVLEDEAIRVPLLTAPAAKSVHHAWVGGLLEHTLSVATLCLRFCDHYPDLDRQTLLAGAICHDLGKIWEFSGGLANDYTDAGRLVGHINLCLGKLDRHLAKSGLDEELILHFQHLILSHHGLYEYGSPRLPQTAEAFALHYADNIDAKITQSRSLFGELEDGESGWSPYQKSLERQLFQAPKTPEAESRKPRTSKRTAAEPEAPRLNQCSLL